MKALFYKTLCAVLVLCLTLTLAPTAQGAEEVNPARQKVIDSMIAMGTVKWTAGANFSTKNGSSFIAGKVYYGIPYSQSSRSEINLSRVKNLIQLSGGRVYTDLGRNDCSYAVCTAMSKADDNVKNTKTADMNPGKNGFVKVGKYTFDTDKATTCKKNGKEKMFACYALLQPGDAIVRDGHTALVRAVDHANQKITFIEQSGSYYLYDANQGKTLKKVSAASEGNSTWHLNRVRTYENLFSGGYIPITCKALSGVAYQTHIPTAPTVAGALEPLYDAGAQEALFAMTVNDPELYSIVGKSCTVTDTATGAQTVQTVNQTVAVEQPTATVYLLVPNIGSPAEYQYEYHVTFANGTMLTTTGAFRAAPSEPAPQTDPPLTTPTDATPTDVSPTPTTPTDAAPTHTTPTDATPTHTTPMDATPTDAVPRPHGKGDVNGSGKIDPEDARLILRYSVGLERFSEAQRLAADADGSGRVEPSDARLVLRASVGLETLP